MSLFVGLTLLADAKTEAGGDDLAVHVAQIDRPAHLATGRHSKKQAELDPLGNRQQFNNLVVDFDLDAAVTDNPKDILGGCRRDATSF